MRLIDADALDITLADAQSTCKKNGGNFRYGVLSNVRANIADAPTIDAIPVEWLKQQRECNDPESVKDINGAFVTICVDGVLALWRKEQEAR